MRTIERTAPYAANLLRSKPLRARLFQAILSAVATSAGAGTS
jgi:hypothetical protein